MIVAEAAGGLVQPQQHPNRSNRRNHQQSPAREGSGNVLLPARASRLPKDSVINVSQLLALDRAFLAEHVSTLSARWQSAIDAGLGLILELWAS